MLKKIKPNHIYMLIMLLILLPIIILGFYSYPSSDDFSYSINTYHTLLNGGNFIDLIVAAFNTSMDFMETWQGLYTSAFLLALQPGIFGEQFYFITVLVILGILFLGIYRLVKTVRKYIFESKIKQNLLLSLLILFFIAETIPNAHEAFYWFNGAVNYLFFVGLLLIIVAEYITIYKQEKLAVWRLILLSILTFLLSGGNHVTMFAGLFIEFFVIIFVLINKNKKLLTIPFITGFWGCLYNITSPGTGVRAGAVAMDSTVWETIYTTFKKSFNFFGNYTSFSLILFVTLILAFLYKDIKNWKINFNKKYLIIPILTYTLLCGMYCVPYYALGGYGGGRVSDTMYISYVILLLLNLIVLFKYLLERKILNVNKIKIGKPLQITTVIIIILFIGYYGNNFYYNSTTYEAVKELTNGEAIAFANEQQARFEKYKDESIDEVILEPLKEKPYLIGIGDICVITDTEKCDNKALNEYFDKKVIGIIEKE